MISEDINKEEVFEATIVTSLAEEVEVAREEVEVIKRKAPAKPKEITTKEELEEMLRKTASITNPLQLRMLSSFYFEHKALLADNSVTTNYKNLDACKKRAMQLILINDQRLFGDRKLFGDMSSEFRANPVQVMRAVEFLAINIFYDIIGHFGIDEDTFLKSIINYQWKKGEWVYRIWGKSYREIYNIIAFRNKQKMLTGVEYKLELRDPMQVLTDNVHMRCGTLLELTDSKLPNISEKKGVVFIDSSDIHNFDSLWERALKVYVKEYLLKSDELSEPLKKIVSKINKLKNQLQRFVRLLTFPDTAEISDDPEIAKNINKLVESLRKENLAPIREDVNYRLSLMCNALSDELEAYAMQKIKRIDQHIDPPQTIFLDMRDTKHFKQFSNGAVRYPIVSAKGVLRFSDGSVKNHKYNINANTIGYNVFSSQNTPWAKFPLENIKTKFINSGLGMLSYPKRDGSVSVIDSGDEDYK